MKTTYLIQRVSRPRPPFMVDGKPVSNPFTFGGGMRDGGLKPEAMQLFTDIFSFDYMGASEFEHGALPEALMMMANYSTTEGLVLETLEIKLKDIKLGWVSKRDKVNDSEKGTVYVVCAKTDKKEVCERVRHIAKDERKKHPDIQLKESVRLGDALKIVDEDGDHPKGGIELDNGFFITVDKDMAEKFFAIFHPAVVEEPLHAG